MKKQLDLSAPWYTYQNQLEALFEHDSEIEVSELEKVGDGEYQVTINTSNAAKYDVLRKVIYPEIKFGNIIVYAVIEFGEVPDATRATIEDFKILFNGNKLFDKVEEASSPLSMYSYVVFNPELIQFYNDDLKDYRSNYNALAADVAKAVLIPTKGISFCTKDIDDEE